jgi:hypothetical protein
VARTPHREPALVAGETPEALEDVSWTAWWRDDSEVVFDARAAA